MGANKGSFTSETAKAAAAASAAARRADKDEQGVTRTTKKLTQRQLEDMPAEQAREIARRTMQGLMLHKDPRIRREAARYVLDEERADRDGAKGPTKIVYETRALPPVFDPKAILAPPPAKPIAADA